MITVFILDFKGELIQYFQYIKNKLNLNEMLFLNAKNNFYINPLEPPDYNIPFDTWSSIISDAIAFALGIREESRSALLAGIKKANFEIPKITSPSLIDVYPILLELRPRSYDQKVKSDYYGRAEFRVLMVLLDLIKTLGCRKGIPFGELVKKNSFLLICRIATIWQRS